MKKGTFVGSRISCFLLQFDAKLFELRTAIFYARSGKILWTWVPLFYIEELKTTHFFSFFHNEGFDDALPIRITVFPFCSICIQSTTIAFCTIINSQRVQ